MGPPFHGDLLRKSDIANAVRTHWSDFVIHLAAIIDSQASKANPVRAHYTKAQGT
jgi:nucleoside-diphosphate-sugar epimerase